MLVNRYCSSIATQSARYLQSPYYGFYDLNHHKMIMLLTVNENRTNVVWKKQLLPNNTGYFAYS